MCQIDLRTFGRARLMKKVRIRLVSNHSTVTDLFKNNQLTGRFRETERTESIFVSFDLVVTSANLCYSNYSSYQYKLYRLVKFLKENRGVGYRRISHILTHKGYRSSRTNSILKPNYIYSIYKKGKIREERYGRVFESKIENTFCYIL